MNCCGKVHLLKQRFKLLPCRRRRYFGLVFLNLIKEVRLGADHTLFAASPDHLDLQGIGGFPSRKDSERLVTRKVASTADHFLSLLDRAAVDFDLGSNALAIGGISSQADRHPPESGFVA